MPATSSANLIFSQHSANGDTSVTEIDVSLNVPPTPGQYVILTYIMSVGYGSLGTFVPPSGFTLHPSSPSSTRQIFRAWRLTQSGDPADPGNATWTNPCDVWVTIDETQNVSPVGSTDPFLLGTNFTLVTATSANHVFTSLTPTRLGALPLVASVGMSSTASYKSPNTNDYCQTVDESGSQNSIAYLNAEGPGTTIVSGSIQQTPTVTAIVPTIQVAMDLIAPPAGPVANAQIIALNSGGGGVTSVNVIVTDNKFGGPFLSASIADVSLATVSGGGATPGPVTFTVVGSTTPGAQGTTTLTITDGVYSCQVEVVVLSPGGINIQIIGSGQSRQVQIVYPGGLLPISVSSSDSSIAYTTPSNTPGLNPVVVAPIAVLNINQVKNGFVTFSVSSGSASGSIGFAAAAPPQPSPYSSGPIPQIPRPWLPKRHGGLRAYFLNRKALFISRQRLAGIESILKYASSQGGGPLFSSINPADRLLIINNGNGPDPATLAAYNQLVHSPYPVFVTPGSAGWTSFPTVVPKSIQDFITIQQTYGGMSGIVLDLEIGGTAAWKAGGISRSNLIDAYIQVLQTIYSACRSGGFPQVGITTGSYFLNNFGTSDGTHTMYQRAVASVDFSVYISYKNSSSLYISSAQAAGLFSQNGSKPIWGGMTTTYASSRTGIGYYNVPRETLYSEEEVLESLGSSPSYAGSAWRGVAMENANNNLINQLS